MDERALAFLRELERADEAAAATLAELDGLAREVEKLRADAAEATERLDRLPAERAAAVAPVRDAEHAVAVRREEHAAAKRELEAAEPARDSGRLSAARRAEVRARDVLRMADRRLETARTAEGELAEEEKRLAQEVETLALQARVLARSLADRPGLAAQAGNAPADDLGSIAAWATAARAALFVVRGNLVRQREALIRQANELGAAVLGEPLSASSTAVVARRIEGKA